jgi:hypothetical protein
MRLTTCSYNEGEAEALLQGRLDRPFQSVFMSTRPCPGSFTENYNKSTRWNSTWSTHHRISPHVISLFILSVQVTFTLKKNTCPPVQLNNKQLTQTEEVKYLGIHLDRKLNWRKHISAKRKQLDVKLRSLYWIISRKSQLSRVNKLLVYKAIMKPIWTYGVQLWGYASNSNLEILERFQ